MKRLFSILPIVLLSCVALLAAESYKESLLSNMLNVYTTYTSEEKAELIALPQSPEIEIKDGVARIVGDWLYVTPNLCVKFNKNGIGQVVYNLGGKK